MENEKFVKECENNEVGIDIGRKYFLKCENPNKQFCPYREKAVTEKGSMRSCGYYEKNNLWGEENE